MDFNVTINGDVNIMFLTGAEEALDMEAFEDLLCEGCDGCDGCDALEDEDDYDLQMSGRIVALLTPGELPKILTFEEADHILPGFYEMYDDLEGITGDCLSMYFRRDHVLTLGEKQYLIGPAVFCFEDEDADLCSLSGEDIYHIYQFVDENKIMLCADGKELPAIQLPV